MTMRSWVSHSEEETASIAAEIAALLPPRGVFELHGDLGAGKTTLLRGVAVALGADPEEISSPTFSIVNEYSLENGSTLLHLDCYRLSERTREWEEIGISDLLRRDARVFIEWPKEGFERYATSAGRIDIAAPDSVHDDETRQIRLELFAGLSTT